MVPALQRPENRAGAPASVKGQRAPPHARAGRSKLGTKLFSLLRYLFSSQPLDLNPVSRGSAPGR